MQTFARKYGVTKFIGDTRLPRGWFRIMETGDPKYLMLTALDGPGGYGIGEPFPIKKTSLPPGALNPPIWWPIGKEAVIDLVKAGQTFQFEGARNAVRSAVREATPPDMRVPAVRKDHVETLLQYAVAFGLVRHVDGSYEPSLECKRLDHSAGAEWSPDEDIRRAS